MLFRSETKNGWIQLSKASDETKKAYYNHQINSRTKRCFKVGNVFDIAQTSFPKEEYPSIFYMGYGSKMHEDICMGVSDFIKVHLGCEVKTSDLSSITLRGRYISAVTPDESAVIELSDKLASTQKLSTLTHELGHAFMHMIIDDTSVSQKGFEADAFSIMLSANFGVEITETRKKHLADHYNTFSKEIIEHMTGDKTDINAIDKKLDEKLMESFSEVYKVYKENINLIQDYVEKYLPKDKMISDEITTKKTNKENINADVIEPIIETMKTI